MPYRADQAQVDWLGPLQASARASTDWLAHSLPQASALKPLQQPLCTCLGGVLPPAVDPQAARRRHHGAAVQVGGQLVQVVDNAVHSTPFGSLLHFERADLAASNAPPLPQVLIVAPLASHFATLLADTVHTQQRPGLRGVVALQHLEARPGVEPGWTDLQSVA